MLLQDSFSFQYSGCLVCMWPLQETLSSVIPSSILPKMEKTRLKNADEMVECFRYLVDGYSWVCGNSFMLSLILMIFWAVIAEIAESAAWGFGCFLWDCLFGSILISLIWTVIFLRKYDKRDENADWSFSDDLPNARRLKTKYRSFLRSFLHRKNTGKSRYF